MSKINTPCTATDVIKAVNETSEAANEAVATKQDKLTAGENIKIEDNTISAVGDISLDYNEALNKPKLNGVEIGGDKSGLDYKLNRRYKASIYDTIPRVAKIYTSDFPENAAYEDIKEGTIITVQFNADNLGGLLYGGDGIRIQINDGEEIIVNHGIGEFEPPQILPGHFYQLRLGKYIYYDDMEGGDVEDNSWELVGVGFGISSSMKYSTSGHTLPTINYLREYMKKQSQWVDVASQVKITKADSAQNGLPTVYAARYCQGWLEIEFNVTITEPVASGKNIDFNYSLGKYSFVNTDIPVIDVSYVGARAITTAVRPTDKIIRVRNSSASDMIPASGKTIEIPTTLKIPVNQV